MVQPLWRTVWRFLRKLKIKLLHDLAIPPLVIYPELCHNSKNICTPIFTAALFTIVKTRKQRSVDRGMAKDMVHLYPFNGILLSHKKE